MTESYAYDVDGNRIRKTSGSLVTRTYFPHYEEEQVTVWPYPITAVKHYSFNGMTIAVRRGGTFRYTHTDHLGSSSGQTDTAGNAIAASYLRYYAYGTLRSGDSSQSTTDRTFIGQKQDGTGLLLPSPPPTCLRVRYDWCVAPSSPSASNATRESSPKLGEAGDRRCGFLRHRRWAAESSRQRHRQTPHSQPDQQHPLLKRPGWERGGGQGQPEADASSTARRSPPRPPAQS